ncbi:hypothetical protein GDO78_021943 [Eleutherodactylus coqui]|uniref:CCHC-type domain-containing protein n=2 Tax=Eleutherodactylus coqui TaxID=57060 RepID=A0A8J6BGV3_ELECQ|nr:hypothetical protein GDO78_021943 [Eleutherodactylus coqui]
MQRATNLNDTTSKKPFKPKTKFGEKLLQSFKNVVSLKDLKSGIGQMAENPEWGSHPMQEASGAEAGLETEESVKWRAARPKMQDEKPSTKRNAPPPPCNATSPLLPVLPQASSPPLGPVPAASTQPHSTSCFGGHLGTPGTRPSTSCSGGHLGTLGTLTFTSYSGGHLATPAGVLRVDRSSYVLPNAGPPPPSATSLMPNQTGTDAEARPTGGMKVSPATTTTGWPSQPLTLSVHTYNNTPASSWDDPDDVTDQLNTWTVRSQPPPLPQGSRTSTVNFAPLPCMRGQPGSQPFTSSGILTSGPPQDAPLRYVTLTPDEAFTLLDFLPDPEEKPMPYYRRIVQIQKIYSATWRDLKKLTHVKTVDTYWPIIERCLSDARLVDDQSYQSGVEFCNQLQTWAQDRLAEQAIIIQNITQDKGESVGKFHLRLTKTFDELGFSTQIKAHVQMLSSAFVMGLQGPIKKGLIKARPEYKALTIRTLLLVAKALESQVGQKQTAPVMLTLPPAYDQNIRTCFACGRPGHIKRNCRTRRPKQGGVNHGLGMVNGSNPQTLTTVPLANHTHCLPTQEDLYLLR